MEIPAVRLEGERETWSPPPILTRRPTPRALPLNFPCSRRCGWSTWIGFTPRVKVEYVQVPPSRLPIVSLVLRWFIGLTYFQVLLTFEGAIGTYLSRFEPWYVSYSKSSGLHSDVPKATFSFVSTRVHFIDPAQIRNGSSSDYLQVLLLDVVCSLYHVRWTTSRSFVRPRNDMNAILLLQALSETFGWRRCRSEHVL